MRLLNVENKDDMGEIIAKLAMNELSQLDGTYIMNPAVLAQVQQVYYFCGQLCNEFGGEMKLHTEKERLCAAFELTLPSLDIISREKDMFAQVIQMACVLNIEPVDENRFLLMFNIPNLWILE